jgi:hypothetical protein
LVVLVNGDVSFIEKEILGLLALLPIFLHLTRDLLRLSNSSIGGSNLTHFLLVLHHLIVSNELESRALLNPSRSLHV